MTLKLEVGKRYVRAWPFYDPDAGASYDAHGVMSSDKKPSHFDLVAEVEAPVVQAHEASTLTSGTEKLSLTGEAEKIVNGQRQTAYGTPEDNFERIARFWSVYFQNTGRQIELTAADVSPMMRLMKEARLCATPDHRDSLVDIIGYTLTGARVNKVE